MKILSAFLLLLSFEAMALDAVVTVLETPMLKSKSIDAPVVQYLRKGDVIKLHPSVNKTTKYNHLAPGPEKYHKLKEELDNSPEWKEDPLFKGKSTEVALDDEFIPTLDRQGNLVYVMRDHLYIYFEDEQELTQTTLKKDPTDYRLEEPLPKNYPLIAPSGYRGQVLLGLTQPYYESYPYIESVKQKGYMSPLDVNFTLLRRTPDDKQDRFYFGGTFNIRGFSNSYTLFNDREAKEQGIKLGVGPYITYDAYKGEKHRINLYGSINFNFFNQLIISQSDGSLQDKRTYRSYSIAPRIGIQYHLKGIMEDVDFVVGTSMEVEPATTFRSQNAAQQPTWWVRGGSDKFKTRTTYTLAGYLGFQTAY